MAAVVPPRRVARQVFQKVHPNIFVFFSHEAKPQEKRAEREGGVFRHRRFFRQRPRLVDGLCGDGKRQRDVRARHARVQRALKAAPLQCAAVEYRMQVEGVMLSST